MTPAPPGGYGPPPGPNPAPPHAMVPHAQGQPAGMQAPAMQGTQALAGPEQVLYQGEPALIASLGALFGVILSLGLYAIVLYFRRGGTSYKITTQRIVIESGIFSKKMEQLDLYRVNDFSVERPFGQRIMGTGNLRLSTFDKTSPILMIEDLKTDVMGLYETLRQAVEAAKQARGVRVVDYE